LLEIAHAHFGNRPHRRIISTPGQDIKEAGQSQ
jgi:hypothetical protein